LGPWSSLLRRIPDKNDHCAFTRGSRGEVMIFFEKNKVLGVEPNRVLIDYKNCKFNAYRSQYTHFEVDKRENSIQK
jgi:hypothetical protein